MSTAIFLDFDGVLHPAPAIIGLQNHISRNDIEKRGLFRWVAHLEKAIADTPNDIKSDLCIAVHSSWRQLANIDQQLIKEHLGSLMHYYVGMTNPELPRWESIKEMVSRAGFDSFIVIDDAVQEFPHELEELVVCNPLRGISDEQVMGRIQSWLHQDLHQKKMAEQCR